MGWSVALNEFSKRQLKAILIFYYFWFKKQKYAHEPAIR